MQFLGQKREKNPLSIKNIVIRIEVKVTKIRNASVIDFPKYVIRKLVKLFRHIIAKCK